MNEKEVIKQYRKVHRLLLKSLEELKILSITASRATGHNLVAMITNSIDIEFSTKYDSDGLENRGYLDIDDVIKLIENGKT